MDFVFFIMMLLIFSHTTKELSDFHLTFELICCSSETNPAIRTVVGLMARTCLGKALKSYGRSLSLWARGIFHQTVINTFDNKRRNRVDSKWQMRERKDAATEGEEREDDVPTEPWLTLTANSTNTCVLSIGKPNVCYLRTFITAGASFSSHYPFDVSPQKMGERDRFYCHECYLNVEWVPLPFYCIFHHLSSP